MTSLTSINDFYHIVTPTFMVYLSNPFLHKFTIKTNPMKTILIPTDFSTNSKAGIRFALYLSSKTSCKLVFYSSIELVVPIRWHSGDAQRYIQRELDAAKNELGKFLEEEIKKSSMASLNYDYEVESGANASTMIVAYAQNIGADFICMSTRGAGVLKKIIGTTTSTLIDTSPVPIFVIPQNYRKAPIQKMSYASDLENYDEELSKVIDVAKLLDTPVELYHFKSKFDKEKTKLKLQKLQSRYPYITIITPQFRGEKTLLEKLKITTRKQKTSLLIMFSKFKTNWFERFFFSGFTAGMTFELNVPLLAFPKQQK